MPWYHTGIIIVTFHCTLAIIPVTWENNAQRVLINSASEIANENFNYLKNTAVISKDVDGDLIDLFVKGYNGTVIVETKKVEQPPRQVVVIVESYNSFTKLLGKLKPDLKGRTLLSSGAKFLIIVLGNSQRIERITKILWSYYATDAAILTILQNKTAIYTYFPYRNYMNCQNTDPTLIGYWERKPVSQVYPNKMKNMKGCPLYISTNKLYHPSTEQKIALQLVKRTMMRLLRDVLNFTPIISNRDYVSIDSDRAKNWSDSLNDVINGVANLSTCSIPLGIDRLGLLDYSVPYFRVRLAWMAPPVYTGPIWWRLLSPLNGYLWLILLIVLFFITSLPFTLKIKPVKKFCYKYFKNVDKVQNVAIRIWGVMLGQPIIVEPTRFRDFYIVGLWIWFTFVIRSVYQSVLIGALKTDTYVGNYADLKEAIDHGYEYGGRAGMYAYFEYDKFIKDGFQIISEDKFEELFHEVLDRKQKFVLATSLEYALAYCYYLGKKEEECGHVLPDSIVTVPLVIWMKMYSPFKRSLAVWLPRLIESGLLEKNIPKPNCCSIRSNDPSPLTRHQMMSCLLCLLLGFSLAAIVFLMELLRHNSKNINVVWRIPYVSWK